MVFLLLQVMFNASICFENSAHFHPLDPNIPKVIPQSLFQIPIQIPPIVKHAAPVELLKYSSRPPVPPQNFLIEK